MIAAAHFLYFQWLVDGESVALSSCVGGQEIRTSTNFVSQELDDEPMSQGSNWNPIDRYGESLHSSEVVNSRELKFCEGCGVLLVRLQGSKTQFCPGCEAPVAIAMGRL